MKKQISYRKLVGLTFILMMLAQVYGVWQVTYANPVSPTIYLDDFPTQATYTIKSDGTNYWRIRYDGYKESEGTDAYVVINAAIASTNALGGGVVFINYAGTITINSPIIMKSKVWLQGCGRFATILKAKNALNNPVIKTVLDVGTDKIEISDLEVDGNYANQGVPNGLEHGIYLPDCTNFTVHDCFIHDVRQFGIWTFMNSVASNHGRIYDNYIVRCGWNGIQLGSGGETTYSLVYNNHVVDCDDVGITIMGSYDTISNNLLEWTDTFYGHGDVNTLWAYGVEGGGYNSFYDNTAEGFYHNQGGTNYGTAFVFGSSDTGHNLIQGAHVINCRMGVAITYANDYNDTVDGIIYEGNCDYIMNLSDGGSADILNCVCHNATNGILIQAGVTYTWICNNDFRGCTDDIADSGTGTKYGYNRWKDDSYDMSPP